LFGQRGEDGEEAASVQGVDDSGGDDGVGCVPADGGAAGRRRAPHRRPRPPLRHSHRQGGVFFIFLIFGLNLMVIMCSIVPFIIIQSRGKGDSF
jgi:hypothetical protein